MKQTIEVKASQIMKQLENKAFDTAINVIKASKTNKFACFYYLFIMWLFISACIWSFRYI